MDSLEPNGPVMDSLSDLIFKQHENISIHCLSKKFHLHISDAIKIMEDFALKHKSNNLLKVNYLVSTDSSDEFFKLQRFEIVDVIDSDCDNSGSKRSHIYSVSSKANNNQVLNFEKFIFEPKVENIIQAQGFTHIKNDGIKIRPSRRECLSVNLKYDPLVKVEKLDNTKDNAQTDTEPVNEAEPEKNVLCKRTLNPSSKNPKQYKRIRICKSDSEDEDEENKMEVEENESKESVELTKPKLEDEPVEKPIPKLTPKAKTVNKVKIQHQTSITSFFKKPPQKK